MDKTLQAQTTAYLAALRGLKSPNTLRAYDIALRRFLAYMGAETPVDAISKSDVIEYRSFLLSDGLTVNAARDYLCKLRTFFTFCVSVGEIEKSPISLSEIPKARRIEYNLLDGDEIEQTLFTPPQKPAPQKHKENAARNRAIVLTLITSGLRNSELRALTVGDLDFAAGTIEVRHGKGDKRRTAPFPALAQNAVKAYFESEYCPRDLAEQKDAILFGSRADNAGHKTADGWRPLSCCGLEQIVRNTIEEMTGRKNVTVHALRHAAASFWDDLGVDLRDVQNALGHASIHTTERVYVDVLHKKKSAAKINAAFSA